MLCVQQGAPITPPGLSVNTHQAAMMSSFSAILQSSSAVDTAPNPSNRRFVGWALSNGEPLAGWQQAVSLGQLSSSSYVVHADDHSYADNSTDDQTMPQAQQINIAFSMFLRCVGYLLEYFAYLFPFFSYLHKFLHSLLYKAGLVTRNMLPDTLCNPTYFFDSFRHD